MPNRYSIGHWLHNYRCGFIPRGLVGEFLYPLMQNKSPPEISGIVALFGWGILAGMFVLMIHEAWVMLRAEKTAWRRTLLVLLLAIFGSSPFVVMTGHLAGYFDHIVQVLGILSVVAVSRRRYWLAGMLCALAILIHEMFVVTVMPAVFFATLLFSQGGTRKARVRALAGLLVVPVLCALVISESGGLKSSEVAELTADIERYGVMEYPGMATAHLSRGFSSIFRLMIGSTPSRLLRPDGLRAILPGLSGILICGLLMRFPPRGWWIRVVLVLTSLAPLSLLTMVWDGDTGRVASMSLFCAFCSVAALGRWSECSDLAQHEDIEAWPTWLRKGDAGVRGGLFCLTVVAGIVVFGWHCTRHTMLMDQEVDRQSMLGFRKARPAWGYRCDQLIFRNSNFEMGTLQGWHHTGNAFVDQPVDRQPANWLRRPYNEGRYWIGTYDRRSVLGRPLEQGDERTGILTSDSFVITRPRMNFLVGGGDRLEKAYVSLEVEGEEILRAGGQKRSAMRTVIWDLQNYVGRTARIRIVDEDTESWGHINTDGFCYRNTRGKGSP